MDSGHFIVVLTLLAPANVYPHLCMNLVSLSHIYGLSSAPSLKCLLSIGRCKIMLNNELRCWERGKREKHEKREIGWHCFLKTEATSEDLEHATYACSTTANNLLANVLFRKSDGLPQQLIIHLQCRRYRRCGFNLWVRKMLWRRKWQATTVFFPGESHWQRSLVGYGPWGHKQSDKTEQLSMWHSTQEAR